MAAVTGLGAEGAPACPGLWLGDDLGALLGWELELIHPADGFGNHFVNTVKLCWKSFEGLFNIWRWTRRGEWVSE